MRNLFLYILILITGTFQYSCTSEDNSPIVDKGQELVTVYFNTSGPQTYGLDLKHETQIDTIDVLAFKITGNAAIYAYRKTVNDFYDEGYNKDEGTYMKSFKVELLSDGSDYSYVFLANANQAVNACLKNNSNVTEKDILLSHLVIGRSAVRDVNNKYLPFPMWGEFSPATPKKLDGRTVYLMRAVASIDVFNKAADFILEEVHVSGQSNFARIVPEPENVEKTMTSKAKVTFPTLPFREDFIGNLVNKDLLEYKSGIKTNESEGEIYLFETEAPDNGDLQTTVHLVVKGRYNGGGSTYYRIDFKNTFDKVPVSGEPNDFDDGPPTTGTGSGGFVGADEPSGRLLRNHRYKLTITSVSGNGYDNMKTASLNKSSEALKNEYSSWDGVKDIDADAGGSNGGD